MCSLEQKKQIIKWYFAGNSVEEILGRFAFLFENRPIPVRSTIYAIIHRFETYGCLQNCKKCYADDEQPPVVRPLGEEREPQEVNVCALAEINFPCNSTIIPRNRYWAFKG